MKRVKRAIMRMLPPSISDRIRERQAVARQRRAEAAVASPPFEHKGQRHDLPGELIVSLTSYSPRFDTLAKTLRSVLAQRMKADRTVLWIAEGDRAALPDDVTDLTRFGLEIRTCRDIRSYKKIIPTLETWPDAYVVTADDDLYYEPNWLETLVRGVVPGEKVIICRRAHLPKRMDGGFAPYAEWEWDVVAEGQVSDDLFPTSGAGALYPPGSLAPEVLDESGFMTLSPTADDIWLYWMARRAGSKFRQVGGGFAQVTWTGSQAVSLVAQNLQGGNDEQLRAVAHRF